MTEGIEIRKADRNDLENIGALYNDAIDWLNRQGMYQWKKGIYPTGETAQRAFRGDCLYCCVVDGSVCGTFIINEEQAPEYEALNWRYDGGKILVLHTLAVTPEKTGQGLGKAVMEFVLHHARINGYQAVRLDVFSRNRVAAGLYLHFGFEYVGRVYFDGKEPGCEGYDCYEKLV